MATNISIQLPGIGIVATIDDAISRGEAGLASRKGTRYEGRLTDERIPAAMLDALQEYREIADDGILSLLDDALSRVLAFKPFARVNPEGKTGMITDLQLYDGRAVVVVNFQAPAPEQ
ncbi:MAG TPA: hypothetical protein VFK05_14870 [Polyangiaceae bacterium]|nr:hypothetical protein [Polyangiaceae bacterium]